MTPLALHKTEAPRARTTADWLVALQGGEPDAIAWCYREHADALLAVAYRLTGNAQDAEDVVHDVFVGLPEAMRKYEDRGQFLSWLKRVTARTALMQMRRAQDRRETPRDVDVIPATTDVERKVDGSVIGKLISDALNTLSPALREVFVLKMVDGHSHAEIATQLGINVGTSEVRLSRALTKMRVLLGGGVK